MCRSSSSFSKRPVERCSCLVRRTQGLGIGSFHVEISPPFGQDLEDSHPPEFVTLTDTWIHDPLAGMRVTKDGFVLIFRRLQEAAEATCGNRVMLVSEGGYDLAGLGAGIDAALDVFGS